MIKRNTVKARVSLVMVLVFMFFLVLPVVPADQVAVAEEGNGANGGMQTIGDLEIGDRVVDNSWQWEHRLGEGYTQTGDDVTKPVNWIVVAKDHYGANSGVTLLSEEIIALHRFDNSTDREGHPEWPLGSNHWGDSGSTDADYGLRKFLNGSSYNYTDGYGGEYEGAPAATGDKNSYDLTFFDAFSDDFKDAVLTIPIPCIENDGTDGGEANPYNGEEYTTLDRVFLPSMYELGYGADSWTPKHSAEAVWPYFDGASIADKVALAANGNAMWYWLRSPYVNYASQVRGVNFDGNLGFLDTIFSEASAGGGVRPALNLSSEILVSVVQNPDGVYEIFSEVEKPRYGDVIGTNEVSVSDAILVLRHIVGLVDIAEEYGQDAYDRARVRGEEGLEVGDAIQILRHIVGLIEEFPAEG